MSPQSTRLSPKNVGESAKALVDAKIKKAPAFAQPICTKLRSIVLKADPEIEEVIKWGAPVYQKNGLVCSIGAFKHHVGFWFFKGAALKDPKKLFTVEGTVPKLLRSIKFTDVKQIDQKTLVAYVREAIALNEKGTVRVKDDKAIKLPNELKKLFARHTKAKRFFDTLSYTNRKEYVRWIESAKRTETKAARLKKIVGMLSKGIK